MVYTRSTLAAASRRYSASQQSCPHVTDGKLNYANTRIHDLESLEDLCAEVPAEALVAAIDRTVTQAQ